MGGNKVKLESLGGMKIWDERARVEEILRVLRGWFIGRIETRKGLRMRWGSRIAVQV